MVSKWINRWTQALQVCMEVIQLKPQRLQEVTSAATQASAAVKAVSELRAQDDRLIRADQRVPATMPVLPITQTMELHLMLHQLQRLREELPASQLERMAHWALQEGFASIAPTFASLSSASRVNVASLREADPFGILMAMQNSQPLCRVTVGGYLAALLLIRSQAKVLMRPETAQAMIHYCEVRQSLARQWSDNTRNSSPEVRSAVSAYVRQMVQEVGQLKTYIHALLAWRAAHQLMLRRDIAQVNFPLLYLQLEAKCGDAKQAPDAWAKLKEVESNWKEIVELASMDSRTSNSDSSSDRDHSQPLIQESGGTPGVPSTAFMKERCQQLVQGIGWLRGVLYPHKTVAAEVSALLAEYEGGVTARLSQVGLRVGSF